MTSKKLYIGKIRVKYTGGNTSDIRIYKSGRTIWVNDQIVQGMNRNSFDGIIREIGVFANNSVDEWRWVEFGPDYGKLEFRKYKNP